MSNLQTDSGLPGQEQTGGNQNASQTGDASNAPNSLAGAELAQQVLNDPVAKEALRKQLQSEKDRGVANANKNAQQALDKTEELANYLGVTDPSKIAQAKRDMTLDAIYQERYSPQTSGTEQVAEAQNLLDYSQAFKEAGLAPSAADYDFATKFQGNQVELNNAVLARKFANQNPATGSPIQGSGSRSTLPVEEIQQKTEAFIKEYSDAVNLGNSSKAATLKRDARAAGIPVDAIQWEYNE